MPGPSPLLFVGEANPYGSDPEFALYCSPPESAGGRLQRLVCGLKPETYLALARINLCAGDWNKKQARERAIQVLTDENTPKVVVMLGRKVQEAFGYGIKDIGAGMAEQFEYYKNGDLTMVLFPHPSGLNRLWQKEGPRLFATCRAILSMVCPSVPWGELDNR